MSTRREVLRRGVASLGVLAYGPAARARFAEPSVEPFGDSVVIAGGPRERGRLYGRRFGDAIRAFLDREIYRPFGGSVAAKEELLRYADACFRVIRAECPVIADELEGMAEATGLRLEEHVLITLHEELYHRGVLPPVPHCTAVAVGPPEAPGRTFVGQTWDWMESVAGMSSVLEWRRDDGPSLLAYAFPGLWVGAGLNSAGLASAGPAPSSASRSRCRASGCPRTCSWPTCCISRRLDAAIEAAKRDRHAGWFTFVMADGSGRLLNIEGSPEGVACEEATGRLVRVGFGSRRMTETTGGRGSPRHPRCASMDALLDRTRGRTDLDAMQTNFGDPARGICVGKATIDMMVFDTTARTAHLSRGPGYEVAWRQYGFAGGAK